MATPSSSSSTGNMWTVEYAGCIKINASMRSLDLDTRALVVKESIARICESNGVKLFCHKKRKAARRNVDKMIADKSILDHSGTKVNVDISSAFLTLTTDSGNDLIARHEMQNISFASGGDVDTLDYVAYVAKDTRYGRACFVLNCGPNLASEVITTLGRAFESRYKEFVARQKILNTRSPHNSNNTQLKSNISSSSCRSEESSVPKSTFATTLSSSPPSASGDAGDRDYYNDLPGKEPPEVSNVDDSSPPLGAAGNSRAVANAYDASTDFKIINSTGSGTKSHPQPAPRLFRNSSNDGQFLDPSSNLIDLNTYILCSPNGTSNAGASTAGTSTSPGQASSSSGNHLPNGGGPNGKPRHEYINTKLGSGDDVSPSRDPFDMQPFNSTLEELLITEGASGDASTNDGNKSPVPRLKDEEWFHGPITRTDAEMSLEEDGDFLVRESRETAGQYILTGRMSGHFKHLLLVDIENNVVRTKDQTFESVNHLIDYHLENDLPIISADSTLYLKNPVSRSVTPTLLPVTTI